MYWMFENSRRFFGSTVQYYYFELPWCSVGRLLEEVLSWWLPWWRLSVLVAAAESFLIAPCKAPPADDENAEDDVVDELSVLLVLVLLLFEVVSLLPLFLLLLLLPILLQLILLAVQWGWVEVCCWVFTFWNRTVVFDLDLRMMGLKLVQFMRSVDLNDGSGESKKRAGTRFQVGVHMYTSSFERC